MWFLYCSVCVVHARSAVTAKNEPGGLTFTSKQRRCTHTQRSSDAQSSLLSLPTPGM